MSDIRIPGEMLLDTIHLATKGYRWNGNKKGWRDLLKGAWNAALWPVICEFSENVRLGEPTITLKTLLEIRVERSFRGGEHKWTSGNMV